MSFDPGDYTNKKQHKYEVITVITNTMNMLTMTLVAMLLSTASARTLKDSGDDLHPAEINCSFLYICATNELVGDKKLTTNNPNPLHGDHGVQDNDVLHYDAGWCKAYKDSFGYGPDVENLEFYLDGVLVHKGHYQQNYCGLEAGDIHTDDPNADIREGSVHERAGYVIIKAWK